MSNVDPKLTAKKVYPIDRVHEEYDEPSYGEAMPDPTLMPKDFFQQLAVGCCTGIAFSILVTLML